LLSLCQLLCQVRFITLLPIQVAVSYHKKTEMIRLFLFLILFTVNPIQSYAQRIEIGQNAEEIKQLIEWSTKERSGYDHYGNSNGNNVTWDTKYNNGIIKEVIQCYKKEYLFDLRMYANYCKRYIMKQGKLSYVLTQYENVSLNKLKILYDNLYAKNKLGNLYFSDDYKHYSKVYLSKNGYATIKWKKTEMVEIPIKFRKLIKGKLEKEKREKYQQELEKEKELKKEKEIKSKIYDLKNDFPNEYKEYISELQENILEYLRKVAIYEINNNVKKYFTFNGTYEYYCFQDEKGHTNKTTKLIKSNSSYTIFDNIFVKLPLLEKEGYRIRTSIKIDSLNIKYVSGLTKIKINKDKIEFKSNPPSEKFQHIYNTRNYK